MGCGSFPIPRSGVQSERLSAIDTGLQSVLSSRLGYDRGSHRPHVSELCSAGKHRHASRCQHAASVEAGVSYGVRKPSLRVVFCTLPLETPNSRFAARLAVAPVAMGSAPARPALKRKGSPIDLGRMGRQDWCGAYRLTVGSPCRSQRI